MVIYYKYNLLKKMLRNQIITWIIIIFLIIIFWLVKWNFFFISLSILWFIILWIHLIYINLKIWKSVKEYIPVFEKNYNNILKIDKYLDNKNIKKEYIVKKDISNFQNDIKFINNSILKLETYVKYSSDKELNNKIQLFNSFLDTYQSKIKEINDKYYESQLQQYGELFDSIEKYPLDEMQKKAILTPEKNLLVIAGAWSWKTSTIVWKVKYLLSEKKIEKEEILLISFTSASAKEMNSRIKEKLNLNLDVMTFHKLWKNILESHQNNKINILTENDKKYFRDKLYNTLLLDIYEDSPELFSSFFWYLINPPKLTFEFNTIWEIEDYRRENNITTLKERLNTSSIRWEYLKSMEEVEIANFLFLNGINYTYEKQYEINTTNSEYWQYKPDFYLDDYNIYIEHYWIDENWNVPKFFGDWIGWYSLVNKKYNEWIKWKESLHKENKTKLICTYSHENHKWILFENLKNNLIKHWVKFNTLDKDKVIDKLLPTIQSEYSNFMDLLFTFLGLYKANNMWIDELYNRNNSIFNKNKKNLRTSIFIKIFEKIYKYYQDNLQNLNVIDFDDMINYSASFINEWVVKTPYKYVIIDEFQDIWIWRYKLIKSILNQNNWELFCVWDDWQSIYRFTWWDLNIFTNFKEYFPYWEQVFINKTYRYPQEVNEVTHKFITKNKSQIDKILESWNKQEPEKPIFNIISYEDDLEKSKILDMILLKYKKNIVALWRNKKEKEVVPNWIDFMTVHGSKWLESDYIVILNWNNWINWFPSEKKDNELLNLVLAQPDNYKFSEERRLFYVALTRAKKKTFILTKKWNKSSFIEELEDILWIQTKEVKTNRIECPRCKKWELIPRENFTKWALWCNNYPKCNYTIKTISPIKKHKWLPLSKLDDKWLDWMLSTFKNDTILQNSIYYEKERRKHN